ncbi:RING finger domain-containing protein [Hirsutella rhossiliensis]|uniref:RING finger domain-containing protein n=1 Tax=Hirsutella rhossiliensis TaxID=111463 RepID=A0A9P8SG70_9HYPO|nr:RING finger domain-containing protein [Hirsutella rhossiliensis]KAH0960140.1 RING finger domain-containing protein [Hirsutella rhossiliensis]
MTRPTIIRADTIDLQQQSPPSAKDHHRLLESASDYSLSPIAPHQAETLREVAHETAEEEAHSPRALWMSGKGSRPGDAQSQEHGAYSGSGGAQPGDLAGGSTTADMYDDDLDHQDDLAISQNDGTSSSSDEGDLDGDGDLDEDDMMDKISSSPSIEDEDIDFEFVYALHTFVATVEGQANATKGDTMVLLDDSNSYWWLVRVVKDSSIGYLPAEHIETPTERLARLNKHRNIDLSATMLGDQAQKPKNSFKAIRRRRKTVTFAEPTYVNYSDFDYSTEDDDGDELFSPSAQQSADQHKQDSSTDDLIGDDGAKVEPLKTRASKEDAMAEGSKEEVDAEEAREGDDAIDNQAGGPSRSRNGTVRNTDSFFKDESLETKKITLTPNLLRDDNTPRESTESATRDAKARTSLDKLEKELVPDKKKSKDKDKKEKEKEKKPSAIRSFFSRKDKKKVFEDDDESIGKRSMDTTSESRDSEDRMVEDQASPDKPGSTHRNSSRLQKPPPASKAPKSVELASYLAEGRTNDVSNVPPASMRIVHPDTRETQERSGSVAAAPRDEKSATSKLVNARSSSAGPDSRGQKTVKAKTRELDGSDDSEAEGSGKGWQGGSNDSTISQAAGDQQNSSRSTPATAHDKTSTPPPQPLPGHTERTQTLQAQESPAHVSSPPPLVVDTSSPEADSPEASPSPDQTQAARGGQQVGGSASKEPSWDDTKLRAFFDDTDHIRDLLAVVYDKTDVEPAGSDHPVMGGLFREQNAKLAEITTQLDNMLGDWLARKQRLRGTI